MKTYSRTIYFFMLLSFLLLPSIAYSEGQEIKEYTVKQGDTLWDISASELKDPFLWPKIWKENPEIANPDRLKPGQVIRIPLYLLQKEVVAPPPPPPPVKEKPVVKKKKEAKKEGPKPVRLESLVSAGLLAGAGYIGDTAGTEGKITGSPSGRSLFGNFDIIFISTIKTTKVGDKFLITRIDHMVKHPITGNDVGYIIEILGIAEVTDFENGEAHAKITRCFDDIRTGDLLDAYRDITPPLTTQKFRKPKLDGIVLAAKNLKVMNAYFDIVFIDKGTDNGIEIGDMFKTVDKGEHLVTTGSIQIISSEKNTSTAIIRSSSGPVLPGNLFTQLE